MPTLIKDAARMSKTGHISIVVSCDIAVRLAQDLELAIEKSPELGY